MYTQQEIDSIITRAIMGLNCGDEPQNLYGPIEYMLSIGGKRIRPRLCLTAYNLFSDNVGNEVVYPAIALEVFHEFTLIHDDIMDNSDTRRGQQTVYRKWGGNVAILSGDVMSILSYKYLGHCRSEVLPSAMELFTTTAVQVCEGQQYDMDFEEAPFITMDDYMSMIGLKTAVLIACSVKMGALLAGAPRHMCDALYEFGYKLGLAFQITDDYLDTFGNEKIFGKKIGGDIMNNKKTWLLVEGFRQATDEQKHRMHAIMAMDGEDRAGKIAAMQELYVELGVQESAGKAILQYHREAMEALEGAGFDEAQMEVLSAVAEQMIHREK